MKFSILYKIFDPATIAMLTTFRLCLSPTLWQRAVKQLPSSKILPLDLGGNRDQPYAAWIGDKILGASTVRVLQERYGEKFDKGSATKLIGTALSNSFFAANIESILPDYHDEAKLLSAHGVGTMVEAAVAAVDKTGDTSAIDDLASWLVEKASYIPDPNSKGYLLNLGGTVEALRIGGPAHSPVFRAVATLGDAHNTTTATAEGNSKKKAEQKAASKLLEELEIDKTKVIAEHETLSLEPKLDEWTKFEFVSPDIACKDGETVQQWWSRGITKPQKTFRRAMMAPLVFPGRIVTVDSWTRITPSDTERRDTQFMSSAVFMVIGSRNSEGMLRFNTTPVFHGLSNSASRTLLGMEAVKVISNIVDTEEK